MIQRMVNWLEDEQIPLVNYVFTFFFAVLIRHYLESYSQVTNYLDLPGYMLFSDIIHFTLSYVNLAMLLILVFYVATTQPIKQVARVILPAFMLLWLTPLLDLVLTKGFGHSILYIQPGYQIDIVRAYLSLGGGFKGVSLGIKAEIIAVLLVSFFYFRVKKQSLPRCLLFVWITYSIIFLWGSSPFLLNGLLDILGITYEFSGYLMIQYYAISNFVLGMLLCYLMHPTFFKMILADARWLRFLHYELMLLLGVSIAINIKNTSLTTLIHLQPEWISTTILVSISLFFASLFSIITNNLSDKLIDQVSNQARPLCATTINANVYLNLGYSCLALSLFYAMLVAPQALLSMAAVIGGYYLYSMPPIRFKRVPLFSKIVIAFNSVVLLVLGYWIVQGGRYQFPFTLIFIILTAMTVAANVIDLKDVKGDQADNIRTLPILLGERQAKQLIGLAYIILFSGFICVVSHLYWLIAFTGAGLFQCYLVNKRHYREWQVIAFSNGCLFSLICLLLLGLA